MKVGVLGTGNVGRTIASKLVALGHSVRMGSRAAGTEAAAEWVAEQVEAGDRVSEGHFAAAAEFAHEMVFNCTAGTASLEALSAAGIGNLEDKILVDVANPLDSSQGMPPTLSVANDSSLGERIQQAFPKARVVKTLNTVNAQVMVEPARVPGEHVIFICGDDGPAKAEVVLLLGEFGWPAERVLDLGEIEAARGCEMYLPLWLRLYGALGSAEFNISVERPRDE